MMKTFVVQLLILYQLFVFCHGLDSNDWLKWHGRVSFIHGKSLRNSTANLREHRESRSFLQCCSQCHMAEGCRGVAYAETECWLIKEKATECQLFEPDCSGCKYKLMRPVLERNDDRRGCKDLLDKGKKADGVYIIKPSATGPFQAFCDMTNGGWTVFQRRVDDSVDFYRGWADYVAGFGNFDGNFWAGLNNIHEMTSCESTELLVTMETFEGESAEAHYSSFHVDGAESGYRLSVSGYCGTAGDSMEVHNGKKFSTYDNDQDIDQSNCALNCRGGWWYSRCHYTNPNGLYLHGAHNNYWNGVIWFFFRGAGYSLKTIEFKVRCN